jgi:hypothetical protein
MGKELRLLAEEGAFEALAKKAGRSRAGALNRSFCRANHAFTFDDLDTYF